MRLDNNLPGPDDVAVMACVVADYVFTPSPVHLAEVHIRPGKLSRRTERDGSGAPEEMEGG